MRAQFGGLGLGDIQLQQFGGPDEVLIRVAEQPGGDAAQQEAVQKVRGALATPSNTAASKWWGRGFPVSCWLTACSG